MTTDFYCQDQTDWLVRSDYLEELDQLAEAELIRLRVSLADPDLPNRPEKEARLRELLYKKNVKPPITEEINTIGIKLTLIPAGTFWMGEKDSQRKVTITKTFWIGTTLVTRRHWKAIMGYDPSSFTKGSLDCPVEQVSWQEAVAFCKKLSRIEGCTYRLPTEAEWEYAARGGTTTVTIFGDTLTSKFANFDGRYPYGTDEIGPYVASTTPVGTYPPNAWGMYDVVGNAWEWCLDVYNSDAHSLLPDIDPVNLLRGYSSVAEFWAALPGGEINSERRSGDNSENADRHGTPNSGGDLDFFRSPPGSRFEQCREELLNSETNDNGGNFIENDYGIQNPERGEALTGVNFHPSGQRLDRFGADENESNRVMGGFGIQNPEGDLDYFLDHPGRRLEQSRTELPNISSDRNVSDVQRCEFPDSEGGEVLTDVNFRGTRQQLVQFGAELPDDSSNSNVNDVQQCGVPDSEGGEVLDISFRSSSERRLAQSGTELPDVSSNSNVNEIQQCGVPDSEGGDVLADIRFRDSGQQLLHSRSSLSGNRTIENSDSTQLLISQLTNPEGGGVLGVTFPEQQLVRSGRTLQDDDYLLQQNLERERIFRLPNPEGGGVLTDVRFRHSGLRLEQSAIEISLDTTRHEEASVSGCELPNPEGILDANFRSSGQQLVQSELHISRSIESGSSVQLSGIPNPEGVLDVDFLLIAVRGACCWFDSGTQIAVRDWDLLD